MMYHLITPREIFSTEGVNNGITNPNYSAYDVPPNNPREKISAEVVNSSNRGLSGHVTYDVPSNNPREKLGMKGVINSGDLSTHFKYDIPTPSNMPTTVTLHQN